MVNDRPSRLDDCKFVLVNRDGTLRCPRIRLGPSERELSLPALVLAAVKRELKLDAAYLGALDFVDDTDVPVLVVVLTVDAAPTASRFHTMPLSTIRPRDPEIPSERFEIAARWYEAESAATRLRRDIEQAAQRSTVLLTRSLAKEDGQHGWHQYFNPRSVGVLSSANGILACVYAGVPQAWRLVDAPLASLRVFQAEEGGWRIRRSLVGSQSDNLVTESTCHCLLAFLEAGHRSPDDETVKRGLDWLVGQQHEDGGWSSTKPDLPSQVYPTALAVRVLSLYQQREAARKGVAWLLTAQCVDGGWGATGQTGNEPVSSSPAYAAAAVSALIAAGSDPKDKPVTDACAYLKRTFDPNRPEPWEATSFNTLVDHGQQANLEYRHFATAYALAALCEAGHDLGDSTVLMATRRLLNLQTDTGTFQCSLTAPEAKPIWAVCGAMYALRKALDSSGRDLVPLTLDAHRTRDRDVTAKLAGHRLITLTGGGHGKSASNTAMRSRASVLPTVATAAATAVIVVLIFQSGVFSGVDASAASKVGVGLLSFLAALIVAAVPAVLTEFLSRRRNRRRDGEELT
jgi:hypothetical protein